MSTYAMAGAIEKFAKNFKDAANEKNKIEKAKLDFEKEKFEFYKQQHILPSDTNKSNVNKCNISKCELECDHNWLDVGSVAGTKAKYKVFICEKCGAQQTEKTVLDRENNTYKIFLMDETGSN